jgi:hypothetical protein
MKYNSQNSRRRLSRKLNPSVTLLALLVIGLVIFLLINKENSDGSIEPLQSAALKTVEPQNTLRNKSLKPTQEDKLVDEDFLFKSRNARSNSANR